MGRRFTVGSTEGRVLFRGHMLQRVPEGPGGEPAFYIAVRPLRNSHYDALARGAKPPGVPREPRRAPRSWGGQIVPADLRNEPLVDIAIDDAEAVADWWQLGIPTLDEWRRAAQANAFEEPAERWEWTSTPAPGGGFFVCGGRYRDRRDDPPSPENLATEREPAEDVGVRLAAYAAPVDERGIIDPSALTLPPVPRDHHHERARPRVAQATGRVGPLMTLASLRRASIDDALFVDPPYPAEVHDWRLAAAVLASGVIARGQGRRVFAWRAALQQRLAHEAEPGPTLLQVLHLPGFHAPFEVVTAVGLHLARAWGGLGLGRRSLALPIGGSLHPTPDHVKVGFGGRLLALPQVEHWSKTGGPRSDIVAWGPPEHVLSEPAMTYSIAATMFALLTGRSPSLRLVDERDRGALIMNRLDELASHAASRRPALAPLRHDLPADLAALIDACLSLDAHARPATLDDMARVLERFADPEGATRFFARITMGAFSELHEAEYAFWDSAGALAPPEASEFREVALPADPLAALETGINDVIDYY